MDEKKAVPLVFFIVTFLGAISLVVLLDDGFNNAGNFVRSADKSPLGIMDSGRQCIFPRSPADLVEFLSERKNVPFHADSCPLIAQDFCIVLNSGSCLKQCLTVVQSSDGVCGSSGSEITGQVVLTPEECKRLALSYDNSNVRFLSSIGAGTQQTIVSNSCTGNTDSALAKTYSVDEPLQAYSRNVFENGDVVGYVIDEDKGQNALEYAFCRDGRAKVSIEGNDRCNNL